MNHGGCTRLAIATLAVAAAFAATMPTQATPNPLNAVAELVPAPRLLGDAAVGDVVPVTFTLPLRNEEQLARLIQDVHTPGNPRYGHYLTPAEFVRDYSPTAADYQAVVHFARLHHLTITHTQPNRTALQVFAPSGVAPDLFGVHVERMLRSDGVSYLAPDDTPLVPSPLHGIVSAVVGVGNEPLLKPSSLTAERQLTSGAGATSDAKTQFIGSGPGGGLAPSDIKTAYSLSSLPYNGAGQTLGLVEFDRYAATDVSSYDQYFSLAAGTINNVYVDESAGPPYTSNGQAEVTLDIELLQAIAPNNAAIYVYQAPNTLSDLIDLYNRIASDDLAGQVSCSWGLFEQPATLATIESEHSALMEMAAQGQSFYAASGDGSTPEDPATQPYAVGVGGTTMTTNGPGGAWESEGTWWHGGASGGGISQIWARPSWQIGVGAPDTLGSTVARDVPDVALDADPYAGYAVYVAGEWQIYGGTSCGAPIWTAFNALVNQARATSGLAPIGFPGPAIYRVANGSDYSLDFHDIDDGHTNHFYPAVVNYDNTTGWGSMIGSSLLTDLAAQSSYNQTAAQAVSPTANAFVRNGPYSAQNFGGEPELLVGASSASGDTANSFLNFTLPTPPAGSHVASAVLVMNGTHMPHAAEDLAISCGNGPAASPYITDTDYSGGSYAATNNTISTTEDQNPAPQSVYQNYRYGNITYTIPNLTPGATYTVRLHFCEDYWTAAGDRVFNVAINGAPVLNHFDVFYASGGEYRGMGLAYSVIATSTGTISIVLTSVVDNAEINGIEIVQSNDVTDISAGGPGAGSYLADMDYSGGGTASVTNTIDTSLVTSPAPQSVYQNYRDGSFTYTITGLTAGASYTVRLHFCEDYWTAAGKRVFNVAINGTPVLSNFDVYATAGAEYRAVAEPFGAVANASGDVTLTFATVVDNAEVNGIEIIESTPGQDQDGLYSVNSSWTEGAVTWNNQPAMGSFLTWGNVGGSGWTSFTLTSYVQSLYSGGATQLNLGLEPAAGSNAIDTFSSRESAAHGPELYLTFTSPATVPAGLSAIPETNAVTLSWSQTQDTTGVNVYRSTSSSGTFSQIGSVLGPPYTDTSALDGNTYWYEVAAINAQGTSALSSAVSASPTLDGAVPFNGVTSSGGLLYGTTAGGGTYADGVVYDISTTGTFGVLHAFDGADGLGSKSGLTPVGNGSFYGVNEFTTSGQGNIFSITASGSFTDWINMPDCTGTENTNSTGADPFNAPAVGVDGTLYGIARSGGSTGNGTAYSLTPSGTYTILHNFGTVDSEGNADGTWGIAGLTQDLDGNLYGVTGYGGADGDGTAFRLTTWGEETVIHPFTGSEGEIPVATMIQDSLGNLYGTAEYGGSGQSGTLFEMTTSGTVTVLHAFSALSNYGVNTDGAYPGSALVLGSDGATLYGVTPAGGANTTGVIFSVHTNGIDFTILHTFSGFIGNLDGAGPSGVTIGPDGYLYVTTQSGGIYGDGTIYRCYTDGTNASVIHSFHG